jgi:chorismate dehydratase
MTSVRLVKVIAGKFWKKDLTWIDTSEQFNFKSIGINEAVVLIGDQCFEYENQFQYKIDLAEEWKRFTSLPFVFACWVANKPLSTEFITEFNNALSLGVNNIEKVSERFSDSGSITGKELTEYLTKNIDYSLDTRKIEAMNLFLEYLREL